MFVFLRGLIFILLSLHGHALSTIGVSQPACKTVSAVISPTPLSATCGFSGTSYALAGAGTIVAYSAGSPYVASLQACSAQCLANTACTNIYFIQGTSCNLHFGPKAFNNGIGSPLFQYYDRSCFICGATSTPACRTVSGVISPTPSGASCGANGSSYFLAGAGIISGYVAGSIYVSSMAVCAALCLSTATCTSIYFIQGSNCNLHFGPKAFNNGIGNPLFQYYDVGCFTCPAVLETTTSSSNTLLPSSTSGLSTSAHTTTSVPTTVACSTVSGLASPTPTAAICGARGASYAMAGAGTLVAYVKGSPYVASLAACSAQCLATSCCTNIYFIANSNCNLHYGPNAFLINSGNPLYDFYDASCFTCGNLSCSTKTSYNMELTTVFTPPAQCTQGAFTQMDYSSGSIWENAIIPVPTSTITSCYPAQFADSVIASAVSSLILPPFTELVCPLKWETFYFNSTYIICCPTNFTPLLPNYNGNRPGLDAICISEIFMNVLMDVTSYNATAYSTVIATSAPSNGAIIFANAFDGTALYPRASTATTTAS
ncbi:hypothetical protein V495_00699 [Pseudogymnoascus sp. VKM F-4514 (FW-929)]|nr:hypothetical protein V495_00699 [Pseudogymnoascus sp. VKM F-4514 (FW-929)]KFY65771.1 hypothetical protein V497_01275 [Pseudogymnoascus sp. VKM F-4516 (FW-969)]